MLMPVVASSGGAKSNPESEARGGEGAAASANAAPNTASER